MSMKWGKVTFKGQGIVQRTNPRPDKLAYPFGRRGGDVGEDEIVAA